MDDTQKALIRYLFQNVLSYQKADVYAFLEAKFREHAVDEIEVREWIDAWQKFEGFVASHGLELSQ